MLINFNQIKAESKLIIFASDKKITQNDFIKNLGFFLDSWESHGRKVKASFKVFFNYIVVIAIDEFNNL